MFFMPSNILFFLNFLFLILFSSTGYSLQFKVSAKYSYVKSTPKIINGEVISDPYWWPCLNEIQISSDQPIFWPSLWGQITIQSDSNYSIQRAPVIENAFPDFKKWVLKTSGTPICHDWNPMKYIKIGEHVRTVSGEKNLTSINFKINWPQILQEKPLSNPVKELTQIYSEETRFTKTKSIEENESLTCEYSHACQIKVSASSLQKAIKFLHDNKTNELNQSYWQTQMSLLPLNSKLLTAHHPVNRDYHYGRYDLIFSLRKVSYFLNQLYNDSNPLQVGDISRQDGETPYTIWHGERQYRHPNGSHKMGHDVDIIYFRNQDNSLDLERNFWLFYSLLSQPNVELIITAYRAEMINLARIAYQKGLINSIGLGRFQSPILQQNDDLNHDGHLHVAFGQLPASKEAIYLENAYNCFLKLGLDGKGSNINLCTGK